MGGAWESGERNTSRTSRSRRDARFPFLSDDERPGMNNSSFSSQHRPDMYLGSVAKKKASSATVAVDRSFFVPTIDASRSGTGAAAQAPSDGGEIDGPVGADAAQAARSRAPIQHRRRARRVPPPPPRRHRARLVRAHVPHPSARARVETRERVPANRLVATRRGAVPARGVASDAGRRQRRGQAHVRDQTRGRRAQPVRRPEAHRLRILERRGVREAELVREQRGVRAGGRPDTRRDESRGGRGASAAVRRRGHGRRQLHGQIQRRLVPAAARQARRGAVSPRPQRDVPGVGPRHDPAVARARLRRRRVRGERRQAKGVSPDRRIRHQGVRDRPTRSSCPANAFSTLPTAAAT